MPSEPLPLKEEKRERRLLQILRWVRRIRWFWEGFTSIGRGWGVCLDDWQRRKR
jgi:hypothetical protein